MRVKTGCISGQRKSWGIVLFLAGILLAQLIGDAYLTDNPLSTYHLSTYTTRTQEPKALFATILWERAKLFSLLWILCAGTRRRWMDKVVPALLLLVLGIYAGLCLACQGITGVGIFFFSLFPHGVMYLIAVHRILHKQKPVQYRGKRYVFTEIASVFFLIILILTGCCLEAAVGNFLLKNYLLAFISAMS